MKVLKYIILALGLISWSACSSCSSATGSDEAGAPATGQDDIPEETRVATVQGVGTFAVTSIATIFDVLDGDISVNALPGASFDLTDGISCTVTNDEETSFHCSCMDGEGYYDVTPVSGAWEITSCGVSGNSVDADEPMVFSFDFHECKINDCSQDLIINGQQQVSYDGFDHSCYGQTAESDFTLTAGTAEDCSGLTATTQDNLEMTIGFDVSWHEDSASDHTDDNAQATFAFCINGETSGYESLQDFQENVDPTGVCSEDDEGDDDEGSTELCGDAGVTCNFTMTFNEQDVEQMDTVAFVDDLNTLYFNLGRVSENMTDPVFICSPSATASNFEDYLPIDAQVFNGVDGLALAYFISGDDARDGIFADCFDNPASLGPADAYFALRYTDSEGETNYSTAVHLLIDLNGL